MVSASDVASKEQAKLADEEHAVRIVWLASYPRSGNTWLRFLLSNYFFGLGDDWAAHNRIGVDLHSWVSQCRDRNLSELQCAEWMKDLARHREKAKLSDDEICFKTHFALSDAHPYFSSTQAAIYLVRNPRDVLISGINYRRLTSDDDFTEEDYARKFISLGGDENWIGAGFGSWEENVQSWMEASDFPVLLVRYEDLKSDTGAGLSRIIRFMGGEVCESRLSTAVESAELEKLRALEEKARTTGNFFPVRKGYRFFNKGQSEQSLDYLGDEIASAFDERFSKSMMAAGYQ